MKTSKEDIHRHIRNVYGNDVQEASVEEMIGLVLDALVEEELPHQREELKRFDGKKFTTAGKVDFLEEIRRVTQ